MEKSLKILKGLHPGVVLERELKKRKLGKGQFALSIHEYPQTISAIINGKRGMNTPLALRIEKELGLEEGYFMTLQVFYEIKEEKRRAGGERKPDLSKFRPAIFWDTAMDKIDWERQKKAVIQRVFERGNKAEQKEIMSFYGKQAVQDILGKK